MTYEWYKPKQNQSLGKNELRYYFIRLTIWKAKFLLWYTQRHLLLYPMKIEITKKKLGPNYVSFLDVVAVWLPQAKFIVFHKDSQSCTHFCHIQTTDEQFHFKFGVWLFWRWAQCKVENVMKIFENQLP